MVAHVGDFGLAKFLQRKNSNYGTTRHYKLIFSKRNYRIHPPNMELGSNHPHGGHARLWSTFARDVYGKRPTDEEFEDGLYLHQFCKIALHKGVMKIIDPHVLEHEEEANDDHRDIHVNNSEIQRRMHHESGKTEECITSIIKVGVECSMPSASERMGIKDALKELVAAKKLYESAR
ncbi:hypothetical protein Syun_030915 [Stephania yunnanensis]|uniref:Uncharacterized protein n=1 Tax=Stephania yunnanensis TaxID=152371 RepID=A0AAP0DZ24_9MAGN